MPLLSSSYRYHTRQLLNYYHYQLQFGLCRGRLKMSKSNFHISFWFPNFATKYRFYFESGIIPQPFAKKFWKMFHKSKKSDALEGKKEMSEEEELEFIKKMEEFVRSGQVKEEEMQAYFYKDPSSLCEMNLKAMKVYESKVDIRFI